MKCLDKSGTMKDMDCHIGLREWRYTAVSDYRLLTMQVAYSQFGSQESEGSALSRASLFASKEAGNVSK